jgi:hypothetical protein
MTINTHTHTHTHTHTQTHKHKHKQKGPLREAAMQSETSHIPQDFIFTRVLPPPAGVEIFGEFQLPSQSETKSKLK